MRHPLRLLDPSLSINFHPTSNRSQITISRHGAPTTYINRSGPQPPFNRLLSNLSMYDYHVAEGHHENLKVSDPTRSAKVSLFKNAYFNNPTFRPLHRLCSLIPANTTLHLHPTGAGLRVRLRPFDNSNYGFSFHQDAQSGDGIADIFERVELSLCQLLLHFQSPHHSPALLSSTISDLPPLIFAYRSQGHDSVWSCSHTNEQHTLSLSDFFPITDPTSDLIDATAFLEYMRQSAPSPNPLVPQGEPLVSTRTYELPPLPSDLTLPRDYNQAHAIFNERGCSNIPVVPLAPDLLLIRDCKVRHPSVSEVYNVYHLAYCGIPIASFLSNSWLILSIGGCHPSQVPVQIQQIHARILADSQLGVVAPSSSAYYRVVHTSSPSVIRQFTTDVDGGRVACLPALGIFDLV